MTIHNKINLKGNLQNWFGPNSFIRQVKRVMKSNYSGESEGRYFYAQDRKTNHQDGHREPDYGAPSVQEISEKLYNQKYNHDHN